MLRLAKLLSDANELEQLKMLINDSLPFYAHVGAAKAVKIIRNLVELCLKINGGDSNLKV